ncbi:MAG: c-type cytochrome [Gammaproteobacteria bacterium]
MNNYYLKLILRTCTIFLLGSLTATLAADGKALYTQKLCVTCHGEAGNKPIMPQYPKLAGQNKEYMLQQIKDIKSGQRSNGMSAAMKALVANVGDEDIDAIADYLSQQ